jgi:hypothetical protein
VIARQCDGILLPDLTLPFDDPALAGKTVADILADPARYEGETLADPNEGVDYGACKAKIMRRADGTPWIHSFAHGRAIFHLRFDARAIKAAIETANADSIVSRFVAMAIAAALDQHELEMLRNLVAERSGAGKRTLDNQLKEARKEQQGRQAEEERDRRAADRLDPRPQIRAPASDAPWLPQMQVLNDVMGASTASEPPIRDIDGVIAQVRVRRVPNMHALTPGSTNEGEPPAAARATATDPADRTTTRRTDRAAYRVY